MSPTPSTAILSAAENVYRFLLFVYPATHRRDYGPLMVQLFRDLGRDSCRQKGLAGLVHLWFRVLVDTATSAAAEHVQELKKGDALVTKKQHRLAIFFSGFPLGLWLVLLLINPNFASRMVVSTSAQPVGWMMMAAVLTLSGIAYLVQRKGFARPKRSDLSSRAVSGTILPSALFVCSIVLFVFPATFLVVFGPALMVVLEAGF